MRHFRNFLCAPFQPWDTAVRTRTSACHAEASEERRQGAETRREGGRRAGHLQFLTHMSRSTTPALLLGVLLYGSTEAQETPRPMPPVVSEILAAQVMLDRAGFSPGE